MTDAALSLRKQEQLNGLRLRLYSDDTPVDGLIFEEAKKRLSDLLERKVYEGKSVNLVVLREVNNPAKSAEGISKILGYKPNLQDLELATARSLMSTEGVSGDILFCANMIPGEAPYVGPLILHELCHEIRDGDIDQAVRRYSFNASLEYDFHVFRYYDPSFYNKFVDYLTDPIHMPLSIKSEIMANERAMELSSPSYMEPHFAVNAAEYRKFRERDQSGWSSIKQHFEDISDIIGYDVFRSMQLAAHTSAMHYFVQYTVPYEKFGLVASSSVTDEIKKALPERMGNYVGDVEKMYSGLPDRLDIDVASSLTKDAERLIRRVFEDDGLRFPLTYEARWGK